MKMHYVHNRFVAQYAGCDWAAEYRSRLAAQQGRFLYVERPLNYSARTT